MMDMRARVVGEMRGREIERLGDWEIGWCYE